MEIISMIMVMITNIEEKALRQMTRHALATLWAVFVLCTG